MTIILGIDPGSRITGYGLIKAGEHVSPAYVASGCIRMNVQDSAQRLQQIFHGIREIMAQFQPHEVAIEQVFMYVNPNSALKLGQARGVAMVASSMDGLPVAEYSAKQIKQAVVGYGGAKKEQVQHMVRALLKLSALPQVDAADALAVALCHANTNGVRYKS